MFNSCNICFKVRTTFPRDFGPLFWSFVAVGLLVDMLTLMDSGGEYYAGLFGLKICSNRVPTNLRQSNSLRYFPEKISKFPEKI